MLLEPSRFLIRAVMAAILGTWSELEFDRLMFLRTVHDCLLGQFGMCRIDPTQQDMFTA